MVVPHAPYETRILRMLDYRVPSPIHYHYNWGGGAKPFKAQVATAAMLVCEPRAFVLSTMGTGKTRSVLYAFDYLRKEKMVGKMLVVAPLSTLEFTWAREVFYNFPGYRVGIVYGSRERRAKILADNSFDIYVINHDGVKVMEKEIAAKRFDVICIDEVASFRNHRSDRHKVMARLTRSQKYLWGLTGTPTPKDPTDAFGIIKLITPNNPHVKTFSRFRDELMLKVSQFKYVPRQGAQETVFRYMQPAVRFTMADCVDMPPVVFGSRGVTMSADQKKVYEALRNHAMAIHAGSGITAANEGVLLNKLLQVSSGCVYDSKKVPIDLGAEDRLKVTAELLEENGNKAIVFCPYVPLVKQVAAYLTAKGIKTYEVSGATPAAERARIFADFQDRPMGNQLEAIVAHPGTMSHGLTLTAANMIVWYAPVYDLEIYQQANARIARPGQQSASTHIVHLVGAPVDEKVYRRLQGKEAMQGVLLELFE